MQTVTIPSTTLVVSRFVFGTASLHRLGSRAQQIALLSAAADQGFTHFDTAPYYGFGLAESSLGAVLAARPSLTVSTKVGLYPPGRTAGSPLTLIMRKAAGKIVPSFSKPIVDWLVTTARNSLEGSLTRLCRDCVDLLLLHEPDSSLLDTEEWRYWLDSEVARGKIMAYGVAGTRARVQGLVLGRNRLATVVQTEDTLNGHESDFLLAVGRPLQLTYGYMSAARRENPDRVLEAALRRNRTGAILVSTRSMKRLRQYRQALDRVGHSTEQGSTR